MTRHNRVRLIARESWHSTRYAARERGRLAAEFEEENRVREMTQVALHMAAGQRNEATQLLTQYDVAWEGIMHASAIQTIWLRNAPPNWFANRERMTIWRVLGRMVYHEYFAPGENQSTIS